MYAITKTVKKHRLAEVKQLQALLHILGHPITVNGMLEETTNKEIKKFQQKHNIDEKKGVQRKTWLVLYNTFSHFMHKLSDASISLTEHSKQLFNTADFPFISVDNNTNDDAHHTKIVTWLQVLLYLLDNNTRITGVFDAITAEKIKIIQQKHNIDNDGNVNEATWQALFNEGAQTAHIVANLFLTEQDIQHKAEQENIDVAIVKALITVESSGSGFYSGCRPKMLFEGHRFWKQLEQQGTDPVTLQTNNKDILYPQWTTTFYTGSGQNEYDRLKRAKAINEETALQSASWGMFHMMGSNAKACGFEDVHSFIAAISKGEKHQLDAFFAFLHHENLFQPLKEMDWPTFTHRYNGAQFRKNGYDAKLHIAFDITKRSNCSVRRESNDALIVSEYTRWFEEALADFDQIEVLA